MPLFAFSTKVIRIVSLYKGFNQIDNRNGFAKTFLSQFLQPKLTMKAALSAKFYNLGGLKHRTTFLGTETVV